MRDTDILLAALKAIVAEKNLPWPAKATIEPPKDPKHGDLAVNIAMMLAKEAKMNPRALAEELVAALKSRLPQIAQADVAGPGFINVTFTPEFWHEVVCEVAHKGARFGASDFGARIPA